MISRRLAALLSPFVVGLPVGLTILDVFGYVAKVDGVSMQPSLNPDGKTGDFVFLSRWAVRDFRVARGEIVSLVSPKDPGTKIIKRVIGVEGDIIQTLKWKRHFLRVPPGHIWIEGDHKLHSLDSNTFGPVCGILLLLGAGFTWSGDKQSNTHRLAP
ncbi:unnamed protein product [Darwinula stevensoni]|uniref:Mitochondrial inner membrane protease subunit 2 n=1 Tax=Darwinula stevensoni TaxID=69355 RepID=A0A7R8X688_9CRUS|nr:unnamed protein product [Darwinula stevensoni]CAG0881197.1 unnamed protein product [Darwinula stevensoni]